jgi:hypothetical protein
MTSTNSFSTVGGGGWGHESEDTKKCNTLLVFFITAVFLQVGKTAEQRLAYT